MKVLLLNGSARPNGNTATALREMEKLFAAQDVETELFELGGVPLRDCLGCNQCRDDGHGGGRCVFDDEANRFMERAETADGFIFATPVYFAHPAGRILSLLDRAFYADGAAFANKPGAALAIARRAGTTASVDVLNKYFTIAGMPVVSSSYWNVAFGGAPGEAAQDAEGMQTLRNLARNMVWLLRCIDAGRRQGVLPPDIERGSRTNFIR